MRGASAAGSSSLAHQLHRATRNSRGGAIGRRLRFARARPTRAKAYPGLPRLALPAPGRDGSASLHEIVRRFTAVRALESAPLSLERLARLLQLANGITSPGPYPLRAAPSAGALYAGEVYVVADRVRGLEAGVYSYHAPTHHLVRIASGSHAAAVASSVEWPDAIARAPASILLTNVFYRYTHRYANRGYRYALIDSGHIGENLRLAAAAEGLAVASFLRFADDALNGLLGIDGREEAVCALHAIGRELQAAEPPAPRSFVEAQHAPGFAPDADVSVPDVYHAATKLVRRADLGSDSSRATGPRPGIWSATDAATLALPAREPPTATLAWAINERRSAARYLELPMPLTDLGFLLELAQRNAAAALAPWIALRVVAHRVDGLPAGVYHDDPLAHRLAEVRPGDQSDALRHVCGGQQKAASAAVGVAMLADLEGAVASGDRAYRDLLIEAGAIGQRIYLGAESIGLAARNLAAFFDDRFNALLRVDGERRAVVHLTMVGPGN